MKASLANLESAQSYFSRSFYSTFYIVRLQSFALVYGGTYNYYTIENNAVLINVYLYPQIFFDIRKGHTLQVHCTKIQRKRFIK